MSRTLRKIIRAMDLAKPKLHRLARELDVAKRKPGRKKRKSK